jgi:hypothetical protein
VQIYVTTDIAASVTAKLRADYPNRRIITHRIIDPVTAHAQVPATFDTGVHWSVAERDHATDHVAKVREQF